MKKTKDPFNGLLTLMHKTGEQAGLQNGSGIGKIITPPPEIQVAYNGMILDKRDLWIDQYWLQGHTRTHKGHIVSATQNRAGGSGDAQYESHNHDIDNDYTDTETLTDTWHVGDYVELTPIYSSEDKRGGQQYIISKKLVRLDGGTNG